MTLGAAIFQILLLDLVFSVELDPHRRRHDRPPGDHVHRGDRRDHGDAGRGDPLANFIEKNPTIVMLALGFLLMIGTVLIADGFGFHVPKGYIYAAMAFSALVEGLNMLARRRSQALDGVKRRAGGDRQAGPLPRPRSPKNLKGLNAMQLNGLLYGSNCSPTSTSRRRRCSALMPARIRSRTSSTGTG